MYFKNPIKPQDPSRQLGYHTYYNNFLTQIFLKFRVFIMIVGFSAAISIAIPLFWNGKLFTAIRAIITVVKFFGTGVLFMPGRYYLVKYLSGLGHAVLASLSWSILLFIFIFPASFYYLKWSANKAYQKKYIRGIAIIPMKKLIKELNKED